ncbi:c6 finger domain-containing protein [Ceraceosorus bombacis]|uniref:C6 finger domain-containing protein n=1 Tax=Ceraceosorus bombacis TaxID=401625 RepID=A0A0P1BN45_9BASI|nr:c6 finger domain-containing protein [Ceraceosorus bombacis]
MSRRPPGNSSPGIHDDNQHRLARPITLPPLLPLASSQAARHQLGPSGSPWHPDRDDRLVPPTPTAHSATRFSQPQPHLPSSRTFEASVFPSLPDNADIAAGGSGNLPAGHRRIPEISQMSFDRPTQAKRSTPWHRSSFAERFDERERHDVQSSRWRSHSFSRRQEPSGLPAALLHVDHPVAQNVRTEDTISQSNKAQLMSTSSLSNPSRNALPGVGVTPHRPSTPPRELRYTHHPSFAELPAPANVERQLPPLNQESFASSKRLRSLSPSRREMTVHREGLPQHAFHQPHPRPAGYSRQVPLHDADPWHMPATIPVNDGSRTFNHSADLSTAERPTSGESSMQKSGKRLRISRACDPCRRRKTKCDVVGVFPGEEGHPESMATNRAESKNDMFILRPCSNCVRARIPCTYLKRAPKRTSVKEYVKELEGRLAALESQRPARGAPSSEESGSDGDAMRSHAHDVVEPGDEGMGSDTRSGRRPSSNLGALGSQAFAATSKSLTQTETIGDENLHSPGSDLCSEAESNERSRDIEGSMASVNDFHGSPWFHPIATQRAGNEAAKPPGLDALPARLDHADAAFQGFLKSEIYRALPFLPPSRLTQAADVTRLHITVEHLTSLQTRRRDLTLPPLQHRDYAWRHRSRLEMRQSLAALEAMLIGTGRVTVPPASLLHQSASAVQQTVELLRRKTEEKRAERVFDGDLHLFMVLQHLRQGVESRPHLASAEAAICAAAAPNSDREGWNGRQMAILLLAEIQKSLFAGGRESAESFASRQTTSLGSDLDQKSSSVSMVIDLVRNLSHAPAASALDRAILLEMLGFFLPRLAVEDDELAAVTDSDLKMDISSSNEADQVRHMRRDLHTVLQALKRARSLCLRIGMLGAKSLQLRDLAEMVDSLCDLSKSSNRFRTLATLAGPLLASTALSTAHLALTAVSVLSARIGENAAEGTLVQKQNLAKQVQIIVGQARNVLSEVASAASADVLGLQHLYWTCQDYGERLLAAAPDSTGLESSMPIQMAEDLWTQTSSIFQESGPLGGILMFS